MIVEFFSLLSKLNSNEMVSDEDRIKWAGELKVLGNELFKAGDFDYADLVYESILDSFLSNHQMAEMGYLNCGNLINSCFLNLAACSLKLQKFQETISLCDHIVSMDGKSAKGFYRRSQAYFQLGNLEAACQDLLKVVDIEPHNKAVKRELMLLREQQHTLKLKEGTMHEALLAENGDSNTAHVASRNSMCVEEAIEEVILTQNDCLDLKLQTDQEDVCSDVSDAKGSCVDFESTMTHGCDDLRNLRSHDIEEELSDNFIIECNGRKEEEVVMDAAIAETIREDIKKMECSVDDEFQRHNNKCKVHKFVNKRNSSSSISIRRCDMAKLMKRKALSFYNSDSLSVMTIRVIEPVKPNLKEATQDNALSSAASPNVSYLSLERIQDVSLQNVARSQESSLHDKINIKRS